MHNEGCAVYVPVRLMQASGHIAELVYVYKPLRMELAPARWISL